MKTEHVVSSGGVMTRTADEEPEVALIFTGGAWCLPKGLVEKDEMLEDAALREVREETGLEGELVSKINQINYTFYRGRRYSKTVHFYLLKYVGGSVETHDREAEDVKWFPVSKALQIMAYPNERRVVTKAAKMLTANLTSLRG